MASDGSSQSARIAVRKPVDPSLQRALEAHLSARGYGPVEYFLPKDDDELNSALCEGRFERVVFADWDALMEPIWKGEARIDEWKAAGVTIELARPPAGDAAAWRALLDETYQSLARWRKQQSRRQTIMACILSILALASLAVLFYMLPSRG